MKEQLASGEAPWHDGHESRYALVLLQCSAQLRCQPPAFTASILTLSVGDRMTMSDASVRSPLVHALCALCVNSCPTARP